MDTEATFSALPVMAIALPLTCGAFVVLLARLGDRIRNAATVAATLLSLAAVAALLPDILDGVALEAQLARMTPELWLYLRVDAMGALFAVTAAALWLIALVYSFGYMAGGHMQNRYYSFFMLTLAWILGMAFAGNLLTLLVFYELFSLLTYPLVVHEQTKEAVAAGVKYVVYILLGGGLVLLGIVGTYFLSGSHTFGEGGMLALEYGRGTLLAVFWLYAAGFGVKAALVPLYGWVPDAHPAAPAPFSAVLSGVMVAGGSFGILRVLFDVFGVELLRELGVAQALGWVAAATVVLGGVLAVSQDDLKRRLAYSTISQMGYVVLGASLLGPLALTGSLVHIANHAFMKGTLFLIAGVLIKRAGIRRVSRMAGMSKRMPLTTAALVVVCLAMIGTPLLSGFVGKWYLGLGMVEVDQPLYLIVLLGGALLAAVYLLPIVYVAYFERPADDGEEARAEASPRERPEAPWTMLGPVLAGTAVTIVLGVAAWLPGLPLSLARLAAEGLLG